MLLKIVGHRFACIKTLLDLGMCYVTAHYDGSLERKTCRYRILVKVGEHFFHRAVEIIMIAKGNRSQQVTDACKKHGGFYLGSIGGPAAVLASNSIKNVELLEYPELGMEAIWKIRVENFPAFILVDNKGNDFFTEITAKCAGCPISK